MIRVARPQGQRNQRSLRYHERARLPNWLKSTQWADLEPLATHPLLTLINNPNPYMTQQTLMWVTTFSLKATGKFFWWFNRTRNGMTLWYVPAHWVSPDPEAKNSERWLIKPEGFDGEPYTVDGTEMLAQWWPDPMNPMDALSPMAASSRTVLTADAIEEAQYTGMIGGQMPANAFIIGERTDSDGIKRRPQLTEDQRKELEARFKSLYGGPRNHGNIILLDALVEDVKRLSMAPTEMDYVASSKIVARKIQQLIGTNPVMMGEIENANRASATVAEDIFLANQINPILTLIGQGLTQFCEKSKLFGAEKIIVYYQELIARDPELEQKDWHKAVDMGFIDRDTFCIHRLGLPALDGDRGKFARVNMALMTIRVDEDTDQTDDTEDDVPPEEQQRRWKARVSSLWTKALNRNEAKYAAALEGYFQRQALHIAERVREGARTGADILPLQEWTASLKGLSQSHLRDAALSGAGIEDTLHKAVKNSLFDDTVFGLDAKVAARIDQYLGKLLEQPYWEEITEHIAGELDVLLHEYSTQGMDSRVMADALMEQFDELSASRAMRISRTEQNGAMNSGSHAMRQELSDSGLVTGQKWHSIIDPFTRGQQPSDEFDHINMDGQEVGIGEDFDVDGEKAPFPGHYSLSPGNRISCRCRSSSVTILD